MIPNNDCYAASTDILTMSHCSTFALCYYSKNYNTLTIIHVRIWKKLEICSVEQGICPTARLYSLAAAYKRGRCKQGAIIFHRGRVVVNFVPQPPSEQM